MRGPLKKADPPWPCGRCSGRNPAIVINRAIPKYFEILRVSPGRCTGILLVEGISHAHAFDRFLCDAINHHRFLDASGFKDGRDNVYNVVKLGTDATGILDAVWPRDRHSLSGATEVRCYQLHPLKRRIERPRPWYRHVRVSLVRTPNVVEILQLKRDGKRYGL